MACMSDQNRPQECKHVHEPVRTMILACATVIEDVLPCILVDYVFPESPLLASIVIYSIIEDARL